MIKRLCIWSTTPPENNPSRANNFNIIRFIAAVMVLYGHMSSIMGVPVFFVYNQAVSTIAVKIFFVISGYLITKSYLKDPNIFRYSIRRAFRIFPGLIGVVLFAVLFVGPFATTLSLREYFSSPSTWFYLRNILLFPVFHLPGVFMDYTYPAAVNGSLWSLPVEIGMYILLPLIIVILKKIRFLKPGLIIMAILFLILDIVRAEFFAGELFVVWGNNLPDWLPLAPFFFVGSFFALDGMKKYLNLQLATAMLVTGALVSVGYSNSQVLLFITLPYFILSLSLCEKPLFCGWFKKCDFSYGMYLYGFINQQIFYNLLKPYGFSLNVMTMICFFSTFLCSAFSWYLIEKPMQSLGALLLKKLSRSKT